MSLSIPSVSIKLSLASKIAGFLTGSSSTSKSPVIIQYSANLKEKYGINSVDIWIDSSSVKSYTFVSELSSYYSVYKAHMDAFLRFNFYFYTLEEKNAKTMKYTKDFPSCVSGGRYCDFLSTFYPPFQSISSNPMHPAKGISLCHE